MGSGREPDQKSRRDDEEALEEIRRLFARYRQVGHHGMAMERDEPAESVAAAREQARALGADREPS
jgi:hypothetical protein